MKLPKARRPPKPKTVVKTRGPGRLEAAAWFGVALAILAWPGRAHGGSRPAPRPPPLPWWRRLFSENLGRDLVQEEVAVSEHRDPGRGRDAEKPSEIPPPGWKDILWRTWQEANNDRIPAVAGSVAYFCLLAVFPALAAFVSLYGLFSDVEAVREQLGALAGVLPRDALIFMGDQMTRLAEGRDERLGLAFVLSLLLSIWSANAGMKALFDGLNIAYEEKEKRGFIRLNALSLTFTAAAVAFLVTATAAVVALPAALLVLGYTGRDPMWMLRWPMLLAMVMVALAVLYRHGPSRALARWQWVSWGSVTAALLWVFVSMAFSWYVANFAHYDRTYGSLGAVVGFMTWIWLSIIVVLFGAELNAEIEHQTAVDSTTGAPEPMGKRHARMADTLGKTSARMEVEAPRPHTPPMSGDKLGPKR
jgi:membrane protein